jgi:putative DNA primase/helicase
MLAWVHGAAVHSPILLVSSPEAECGKSTLLGLINYLVPRGCVVVDVSGPVLFRMIEKWHPTLIVDEADDTFKSNPELRGIINSGWTRGTGVPRCNPDSLEPEFFETFGPKAIGLKGLRVPNTTLSRAIIVDMERKLPGDEAEDFAHTDDNDLAEIRSQLARFAADNMDALAAASPQMPHGFTNRLAANWRMLFAIAELCGASTAVAGEESCGGSIAPC